MCCLALADELIMDLKGECESEPLKGRMPSNTPMHTHKDTETQA